MPAAIAVSSEKLEDQWVVVEGPGSAGLGIARLLVRALMEAGLDKRETVRRLFLVEKDRLLTQKGELTEDQKPYAHSDDEVSDWPEGGDTIPLETVMRYVRPTALIGVNAKAGTFTEDAIRIVAKGWPGSWSFPCPTRQPIARRHPPTSWSGQTTSHRRHGQPVRPGEAR